MNTLPKQTALTTYGTAFIGCPSDVETYALRLIKIWKNLPVPGFRPKLYYWRESVDLRARTSAEVTQFHIARTSDPSTSPVFILIGHTIGTPLRPPVDRREFRHWQELREWLTVQGWSRIAMVGDPDFLDSSSVPSGKIPLTGTLFELFDAMRTDPENENIACRGKRTFLTIFDLTQLLPPLASPGMNEQDAASEHDYRKQLFAELSRSHNTLSPTSLSEFDQDAEDVLRRAFSISRLSPWHDPLPGLEAVGHTMPLLYGRAEAISNFTDSFFRERPTLTLVEGVSGSGKSSFLRGGLIREWYQASPPGAGIRLGFRCLLVEPQFLQPTRDIDPLLRFGELLSGSCICDGHAVGSVGPFPQGLHVSLPKLPTATGKKIEDLTSALNWWLVFTNGTNTPLIVIVDQVEQIESIVRQGADYEADDPDSPRHLSPSWWRFAALLALLSGTLGRTDQFSELIRQAKDLTIRMPVQVILAVRRLNSLRLFPFESTDKQFHTTKIPPLAERSVWKELIDRTCSTYGLSIDADLTEKMACEAESIAIASPPVSGRGSDDHVARASVMPQVKIALQRVLTEWVETHPWSDRGTHSDTRLDASRYDTFARIDEAVDALGETAWRAFQSALAESEGVDLRGIFERDEIYDAQSRSFSRLMNGLVDYQSRECVELTYLDSDDPRACQPALVNALLGHRMLTVLAGRYLRLPHLTVLAHWRRAKSWLESTKAGIDAKTRLRGRYLAGDDSGRWPETELKGYAKLILNWIGPRVDSDLSIWNYAVNGLIDLLDPEQLDPSSPISFIGWPLAAIATGADRLFVGAVLDRLFSTSVGLQHAGLFVLFLAYSGRSSEILSVLIRAGLPAKKIACYVDPRSGQFPLLLAAEGGHTECVDALLSNGAEVNQFNEKDGSFPLLQAASHGRVDCVLRLLAAGANPERTNSIRGNSPLLLAVLQGNWKCAEYLLSAGASPDGVDEKSGTFPLLIAAEKGDEKCLALLLDSGASPNRQHGKSGAFPLLMAAQSGHDGCVSRLLAGGATPNQIDQLDGIFPLLQASQFGHVACVSLLLGAGANPGLENPREGNFALLQAASFGQAGCITLLVKAGANANQINRKNGLFPLLMASKNGHAPTVSNLLEAGAIPDRVDVKSGSSSILLAADGGYEDCLIILLEAGAPAGQRNELTGSFPLIVAAANGHERCVSRLLAAGAEPDQIDEKCGEFALMVATNLGHTECVRQLLVAGANPDRVHENSGTFPLLLGSRRGHAELVAHLLAAGALVDRPSAVSGVWPLLAASSNGQARCVDVLLKAGADPKKVHQETGMFPLLAATLNRDHDSVLSLLAAGADANQVNERNGATSLLIAASQGDDSCMETLLLANATPDPHHSVATSPLLAAVTGGHSSCAATLLSFGASSDRSDEGTGAFPLLAASGSGSAQCVELLLSAGANPNQTRPQTGEFALLLAAEKGFVDIVQCLVSHSAKVDQADNSGKFALLLAAQNGHDACLCHLLEGGASPVQEAEELGAFPLLQASQNGHVNCVDRLLDYGALPDQRNKADVFSLLLAAQEGHTACVKSLLDAGASPNLIHPETGTFPLFAAAVNGHERCVAALLAAGAKLDQVNGKTGVPSLLAAAVRDHISVVGRLIVWGADPTKRFGPEQTSILDVLEYRPTSRTGLTAQAPDRISELPIEKTDGVKRKMISIGLPGAWRKQTIHSQAETYIEWLLSMANMGKESKLSIISAHSLEIERITFFHLVFTVEDRGETKTLDAIFIESAPDVRWLPIGPGLDLDGFAISLENRGRLPNLHSTDATFVWAALALISAVPPFIPIIFEHPISFLEPPVSDGDLTAPAPWRRWTISRGPEGQFVELPWYDSENLSLIRGRVLVPSNGRGMRRLPGQVIIAQNIKLQTPVPTINFERMLLPIRRVPSESEYFDFE